MANPASRVGRPLGAAAAVLGALALTAGMAAAQHPERNVVAPDSLRPIQSVEPRTGPPGTRVQIYTQNMPLQAKIVVGVGAMRHGFEEVGDAAQQEFGEVSATVVIPQAVPFDRPVYLILFNGVFSPIGISAPFHVTNAEGLVRRTGRVASGDASCLTLRDQDDVLYGLSGAVGTLRPGEEVVVEGRYSESETCGQASTIEVVRLERSGS